MKSPILSLLLILCSLGALAEQSSEGEKSLTEKQSLLRDLLVEPSFNNELQAFLAKSYEIGPEDFVINFDRETTACISKEIFLEGLLIGTCTVEIEIKRKGSDSIEYSWISMSANSAKFSFFEIDHTVP